MTARRTGWRGNGQGRSTRPCRPQLEQLENRLAPAVYHVNTLQDTVAANINTGQDASGQVSLRAALTSANANHQNDTIVLGAGVFPVTHGPMEIQGNLEIIGNGPGQTVLDASHTTRLFEVVGGRLNLIDITVDSSTASELFHGDINLENIQLQDADAAAALQAIQSTFKRTITPVVNLPVQNQGAAPEFIAPSKSPLHLVGQPGVGSGATGTDQETTQDIHQANWQVPPETAPENSTNVPDASEEMEKSGTSQEKPAAKMDSGPKEHQSASKAEKKNDRAANQSATPSLAQTQELWLARIARRQPKGQAILFLLVIGLSTGPKMPRKQAPAQVWKNQRGRRRKMERWRNPPRQSRRNRGPPASGPPLTKLKVKIPTRQTAMSALFV
jgi:hypothetical protein